MKSALTISSDFVDVYLQVLAPIGGANKYGGANKFLSTPPWPYANKAFVLLKVAFTFILNTRVF